MTTRTGSDDEYDALSDDFGDIDFDNVPALSAQPAPPSSLPVQASSAPGEPSRDDASSEYSFDDDLDTTTLAALDAFEQTLTASNLNRTVGAQNRFPIIYVAHILDVQ